MLDMDLLELIEYISEPLEVPFKFKRISIVMDMEGCPSKETSGVPSSSKIWKSIFGKSPPLLILKIEKLELS